MKCNSASTFALQVLLVIIVIIELYDCEDAQCGVVIQTSLFFYIICAQFCIKSLCTSLRKNSFSLNYLNSYMVLEKQTCECYSEFVVLLFLVYLNGAIKTC